MVQRLTALPTGLFLIMATVLTPSSGWTKSKNKADAVPQDRIDILATVPQTGDAITRVTMTQHYSQSYLYLEHASGSLTLLDVTDPRHPSVLANVDLPAGQAASIVSAAGAAALVSSGSAPAASQPRTMSIVNFGDPAHPETVRQFANVTYTASDDRRGLIFVANPEGLWILHRNPAEDPRVQENYAHDVLYNH